MLFAVIAAGLVVYLLRVGLDKADKVASSIGVVLALTALAAPYLLPPQGGRAPVSEMDRVEDSGQATATAGGQANTGLDTVDGDRPAQIKRSGDASADGAGSSANTGIQRRARP
ncbi:hypothetical protein ABZS52_30660 [Micromonospora profundi]|uniref:hypothetical protein n=1 Tax=Micromonospora profundi TaxID=1420889 RepID=UPI0033A073E9